MAPPQVRAVPHRSDGERPLWMTASGRGVASTVGDRTTRRVQARRLGQEQSPWTVPSRSSTTRRIRSRVSETAVPASTASGANSTPSTRNPLAGRALSRYRIAGAQSPATGHPMGRCDELRRAHELCRPGCGATARRRRTQTFDRDCDQTSRRAVRNQRGRTGPRRSGASFGALSHGVSVTASMCRGGRVIRCRS